MDEGFHLGAGGGAQARVVVLIRTPHRTRRGLYGAVALLHGAQQRAAQITQHGRHDLRMGFIELREIHVGGERLPVDRKSTRLNSSHVKISYAVFCLKKKKKATTNGST